MKNAAGLYLVVSCAVMAAGGCAKSEMATTENTIAAAPSTAVKPPVNAANVQDESVTQSPVTGGEVQVSTSS